MTSYRQFIEGYESPDYSDEEKNLIDDNSEPLPRAKCSVYSQIQQLLMKKEEDNKSNSAKLEDNGNKKYDYSADLKPYRVLSAVDLTNFETDIRKGQLSRDQLCQKYKVSKSTTARFIRSYKQYGYLKARKPKLSKPEKPENIGDLISRLLAQNPDMTFREIKRRISELPRTKQCLQLQREFFSTFE